MPYHEKNAATAVINVRVGVTMGEYKLISVEFCPTTSISAPQYILEQR